MASVHLTIDGEYLAYAAMKQALEDIAAMKDARPWEAELDDAVKLARAALRAEEDLAGGA